MAKENKIKSFLMLIMRVLLFLIVFNISPVVIYKYLPIPATPLMFLRALDMKTAADTMKLSYKWVPIKEISPDLYQAAVAAEDDHFMTHNGFDLVAISQAFESNQKNDKKVKGGSTISQQAAKNVFLWPHRDYVRKGLEAWFTVLIEYIWGKERIMEVYLNIVELGDGVFGVEAASQKYFKKPASKLTRYEAASLISVLPNPHIFHVLKPSPYTIRYRNAIFTRMGLMKKVSFK